MTIRTNAGGHQPVTSADLARQLAAVCPSRRIDLVGVVALPCPLPHANRWQTFLDEGRHGDLSYLLRDPEDRLDPTRRHDWAATLLVFGQRYADGWSHDDADPAAGGRSDPSQPTAWTTRVARYARGLDYHDILLADINGVMEDLTGVWPHLRARAWTDTGPFLEREYAWLAGLGFLGRNTCLIHEKLGSGLFLGVALTNLDVSGLPAAGTAADEPLYAVAPRHKRRPLTGDPSHAAPTSRCGSCTRCIEACPTAALLPDGGLDAGRCLSTWTIEHRGRVPAELAPAAHGILFGCDICQAVCPWNQHASAHPACPTIRSEYDTLATHAELDLAALISLDDVNFRARFRRTPLWRCHPEGLRRNARRVARGSA